MRWFALLILAGMTVGAILVHGYHPGAEDAEVYLPSVWKLVDPALYPHDAALSQTQARLTVFPYLIAAPIRWLHVPSGAALLGWHALSIFLLLAGCREILRLCFQEEHAVWCGVALVAGLLTIPVAGTALYIMDQYLTSRSLATPGMVLTIAAVLGRKRRRAALWLLFTAAVHPLTGGLAAAYWAAFELGPHREAALALVPPVTPAYAEVLRGRPYLLVTKWAWHEWLGTLAPLVILGWFARLGRKYRLGPMEKACYALIAFQFVFTILALCVSLPARLLTLSRLQPMRSLQLTYILMFLFAGALLGKFLLRRRWWLWASLFLPLCGGMGYAQMELFPASPHLEWPWAGPGNPWARAFEWVRRNTPVNAQFALDPEHMRKPGEDQHGFRALAQRGRLADAVKDAGPVSLDPNLAPGWLEQVNAQRGLDRFGPEDFQRLRARYGVNWVLLDRTLPPDLVCVYHAQNLYVCRID